MCINPSQLPNGHQVACRQCWQCKENRIQDWVGRCIAESKTATHTWTFTLTYGGGDHERTAVLTYSDVQKYFKRLRKAGYKFKYIVAGEFGTAKGRAHWHGCLFFQGKAPKWPVRQRVNDAYWEHGYSYFDESSPKAFKYCCKYVLKDKEDDGAQSHFAMSKKPPLATEYFDNLAYEHVAQGVSPQDYKYQFNENRNKEGKPVQHYMHGATAREFIDAFIDLWLAKHGNDRWPTSVIVDDHIDKYLRYAPELQFNQRQYGKKPLRAPRDGVEIMFSETRNRFWCQIDGKVYHWRKTINNPDMEWSWHDVNLTEVRPGELNPEPPRPRETSPGRSAHLTPSERLLALRVGQTTAQRLSELRSESRRIERENRGRLPMVGDSRFVPNPPRHAPPTPTR